MIRFTFYSILALAALSVSLAEELRFAGVLGNSGGDGDTLITFAGQEASGLGLVLDSENTLWDRGGSKQLNRYSLDGRLLASFPLPDSPGTRGSDTMTLAGDQLIMRIRDRLYRLPLNAEPGTAPERCYSQQVAALSSGAIDGRVVIAEQNQLSWLDIASGEKTAITAMEVTPRFLALDEDGTVYAFHNKVYAWKHGQPVDGYPVEMNAPYPRKIGDFWYSHGYHGTIRRYNDRFEPAPGVVLGGNSGSFIGYLPESSDLNHGRGLVHVRDDLFAVSGLQGVVQMLRWREAESRFQVVRRIGAVENLTALALDAAGNIWTPRGSWRWDAGPETPLTLGDFAPQYTTQPAVLYGKTLCFLKIHHGNLRKTRGPLIDANGWSHFESGAIQAPGFSEAFSGSTAYRNLEGKLRLLVTQPDGNALDFPLSENGDIGANPMKVRIPNLTTCRSLAWFDGRLVAGDSSVKIYEQTGKGWVEKSGFGETGQVYVHSDGKRLVVSKPKTGEIQLLDKDKKDWLYRGMDQPTHVAVSGDRVVVYESGQQRLVKLQLEETKQPKTKPIRQGARGTKKWDFSSADFIPLNKPGGLPISVALRESGGGLQVALDTPDDATSIRLGIANAHDAYLLDLGTGHALLPAGDWSQISLAAMVTTPDARERVGFQDHQPIHAAFSENPADWAPFDLAAYRETIAERKQEIRIQFDQPLDGKATIVIDDADGRRVRNLVSGQSFDKGTQTIVWDGLDERGQLVAPGSYRWRGISHPGVRPEFKIFFADGGEGVDAGGRPWGTNHGLLHHAVSDAEHIYFAAPVTEGGWAIMALDADGRFVQGYEHQQGLGIGHNAIAVDDDYLYCAQDGFGWSGTKGVDFSSKDWKATWTLTVARYDLQTGKAVEFPGKKRAFQVDTMEVGPGSSHPDLKDFNLGGIAIFSDKIYVGCRSEKAVLIFQPDTGQRIGSIAVDGVRHLAAGSDSIYAATDTGVVRLTDGQLLFTADVAGLTVAANGNLWISDATAHQIHEYTPTGRRLRTVGNPGGPYRGRYDRDRMVDPAGLAFGPDGKLWVTEKRWNPKRILAWDAAQDSVVYEKFGMPHYGGSGSGFDPENPRRWIGLGCFWDVDVDTGAAEPTHIFANAEAHFEKYHPMSYSFFRDAGRTFLIARGQIALISEVHDDGTIRDIAAACGTHHFGYGCRWTPPQVYIDAFYEKWPDKRAQERPGKNGRGKPWANRGTGVMWVDRNADGLPQKEEFSFTEQGVEFASGAWGHQQDSLTYRFPAAIDGQAMIIEIAPRGFLDNGIPDYPDLQTAVENSRTDIDLTTGYARQGVATSGDSFGRFMLLSDPEMNAYAKDGKHLWEYPNQWSNVHGSHRAPLPETGVIQGAMAFLGMAEFDDQADVFFLNGNHGRCYLLTSDGLYLDEAFTDVRVSYAKSNLRLGGEIFGGMFDRSSDGDYYVQIGHGPYRIYQLHGIDQAVRLAGSAFDVSTEQITSAEQRNLRRFAEQQLLSRKSLQVPGTATWDQSGKFKTEVSVELDGDHLHLVYRVQDPSPWVNNGRDWTTLFATGDSVDIQIGVDGSADPDRRNPVVGDQRLLIAPFEGEAIAILYQHRRPEGEDDLNPIEFTSPWRGEKVDNVVRLTDVEVDEDVRNNLYTIDIRIPISTLGLKVTDGPLKADFGVTFGDAQGTETQLRSYWANPATMLVDDIPGEIMLHPNLWGEIDFGF